MGNSISKLSVTPASNAKVLIVKKRGSTSAKLKQAKLDLRRQQWLSQVKNEGREAELKGAAETKGRVGKDTRSLEVTPTDGEKDGSMHNGNKSDSSSKSATIVTGSAVESNCSGTNFSGSSKSCSSSTCYSRNISEVEDDGCVDDWEAVADALLATDDKEDWCDQKSESLLENKSVVKLDLPEVVKQPISTMDVQKPKSEKHDQKGKSSVEDTYVTQSDHLPEELKQPTAVVDCLVPKPEKHEKNCESSDHLPEVVKQPTAAVDCRKPKPGSGLAWKNDDAFRPKSLPNPQKQHTFPIEEDMHHHHGGTTSGYEDFESAPTLCPICTENMDSTDLSFFPCSCGFQICLFCHKMILEGSGRCPGCRGPYDNNTVKWEENSDKHGDCSTLPLARSC